MMRPNAQPVSDVLSHHLFTAEHEDRGRYTLTTAIQSRSHIETTHGLFHCSESVENKPKFHARKSLHLRYQAPQTPNEERPLS